MSTLQRVGTSPRLDVIAVRNCEIVINADRPTGASPAS